MHCLTVIRASSLLPYYTPATEPLTAVHRLQVGRDANAELLKSSLAEAGVRLDHLRELDGPSGTAVILVQPSGMQR